MMQPDLRTLDYDAFVTLVFDHPAYEGEDLYLDDEQYVRALETRPNAWYWDVDWYWHGLPNDPLHTLELMTTLFERCGELWGRFTARQIGQGFDLIVGPPAADPFFYPVWNAELPWAPRERLLRAVVHLYERLFDLHPEIEHMPFMFWDSVLSFRYLDPDMVFPPSADDQRIQETSAAVIRDLMLKLNGPSSGPAGLHGARHVNHPIALDAVRQWLANPANSDEEWRQYAEAVLRGEAV